MTTRSAHLLIIFGAFLAGLLLFFSVVFIVNGKSPAPIALQTSVGGPFNQIDQKGNPVTDVDMKGRPLLVFFGFTHCPDVCPTALFDISEILRELGGDGDRMRAMFVTVDPERDTPGKLKDYLSSFDPRLIAATGDEAAIKAIEKAYRVYAKRVPLDGGGYTMDHTAIVYLMDKQGRFVAPFNMKRRPAEAAAELRRYM
ncbi:MAG: SCO family protein [Tardiphaga sp.]